MVSALLSLTAPGKPSRRFVLQGMKTQTLESTHRPEHPLCSGGVSNPSSTPGCHPSPCRAAALPGSPGRSCPEPWHCPATVPVPGTCRGLKVSPMPGRFFTTRFSPFHPENPSWTQGSFGGRGSGWHNVWQTTSSSRLPAPWGLRCRVAKDPPACKDPPKQVRTCSLIALWRPVAVWVTVSSLQR